MAVVLSLVALGKALMVESEGVQVVQKTCL